MTQSYQVEKIRKPKPRHIEERSRALRKRKKHQERRAKRQEGKAA